MTPENIRTLAARWSEFTGFGGAAVLIAIDELAPPDLRGADANERLAGERIADPGRRREWWAGRELRRRLGAELGSEPTPLVSISHSAGFVAGVASGRNGTIAGIGVDLEDARRRVRGDLARKLGGEAIAGLSALERWVILEAAFKANPQNAGTWLSQYRLTDAGADGAMKRFRIGAPRTGAGESPAIRAELRRVDAGGVELLLAWAVALAPPTAENA